jgi:hypothetical protein
VEGVAQADAGSGAPLRLGALPKADAAARVALRVLQEGDFAPGLGFAVTVLSDVAAEAGKLDEAQALLDLLPQQGWPAGVATVLIPAACARLRLAQGRAADAVADFQACEALFSADAWGMPIRDTGYAGQLADAELADVRVFGAPRALGIALRAAGLARRGTKGLARHRQARGIQMKITGKAALTVHPAADEDVARSGSASG